MTSKIITIAQQKGGAGKTTIAAHLAVAIMQKGEKVAAIDLDSQKSLSYWYELREKKFGEGYTGLKFISSSGWKLDSDILKYKHNSDYIIIDSPPHAEVEAKSAIRNADIIIIPMQPTPTDYWATEAIINLAKREGKEFYILLNRVNNNSKLAKDIIDKLDKNNLFESQIGNRVSFASCLLDGKTVTESEPSSQAAREIKNFVDELLSLELLKESEYC